MDELLEQFLIEGRELAQQASDGLLALERDPADVACLDGILRAVHTLKGSVALFDFAPMGRALHAAEDLLDAVRAGRLTAGRAVIDAVLDCIGACEGWIATIAGTGGLPDDAIQRGRHLEAMLRAPLATERSAAPPTAAEPDWLAPLLVREAGPLAAARAAGRTVTAVRYVPGSDCFFLGDDPMALARAIPELVGLHLACREPWRADALDPFACNLVIEALSTAASDEVRRVFRFVPDQVAFAELASQPAAPAPPEVSVAPLEDAVRRTLRVDAARIDALADLVGELIVAKNELAHLVARAGESDPGLARTLDASRAEIERLSGGLHRAVTGLRLTPVARTFRRFPRLVRETATQLGKEVVLEVRGEQVEADKAVVDGLFEPLLHVLRNAVDHGIEDAATRAAAGKPAAGRVTLEARREGDRIAVLVSDDGGGIDLARLRHAARVRGLLSEAALDALDDAAAAELIFTPGFSTAAAVTDISGRGVGMDAVRTAVEALGGRVSLESSRGCGCTVRLSLPQATVVTTVMAVVAGGERFGIPLAAVAETARVPAGHVLPLRDGEAFVLRDRTVPLLRLSALLGLPEAPRPDTGVRVLVTGAGEGRVGVEVDGFAERVDVLLRPMAGLLAGMPGILGSALLGDGGVLMVLDLPELIG